jgi:geranylgeranyl reductase
MILGVRPWYWYCIDRRRERLVCGLDRIVHKLTWNAQMNDELVCAMPIAPIPISGRDLARVGGLAAG